MIKKTLTQSEFIEEFKSSDYKNNFSYNGLIELYNYFDNLGEDINFDMIAICCEFSEYENIDEAYKELTGKQEESIEEMREYITDNTLLIEFEGGIIILNI